MTEQIMSHPSQVSKIVHDEVLAKLRASLVQLKSAVPEGQNVQAVRIRDWTFVRMGGTTCVQIFLDKGAADPTVNLDECMAVHRWLLDHSDALNCFSDEVSVEVGSPGSEPPLCDPEDYEHALGEMLRLETWTKVNNRDKYVMLLERLEMREDERIVILSEGPHHFEIPLSQVKRAVALLGHPSSPAMLAAAAAKKENSGKSKKGKGKA
jgi:ribosome maturation factor RimP